jgi:glyoxylase-like metal-dependent hydrolase (beta-lactamase superfamily II)
MHHAIFPVTPYRQNCSLVWDDAGVAALIDPGGEAERLTAEITARDLTLTHILLTHGHLDHVGAAPELAAHYGVPIVGPEMNESFWLDALPQQAALFHFPHTDAFAPDRWLADGDTVTVGTLRFEVLHCPGHTPGHVVFFERGARIAFVGDVLFKGAIGRTDFPRGDHAQLLAAIRHKLFPLGDDVRFVPGHGAMSSFGVERASNPFLT